MLVGLQSETSRYDTYSILPFHIYYRDFASSPNIICPTLCSPLAKNAIYVTEPKPTLVNTRIMCTLVKTGYIWDTDRDIIFDTETQVNIHSPFDIYYPSILQPPLVSLHCLYRFVSLFSLGVIIIQQ